MDKDCWAGVANGKPRVGQSAERSRTTACRSAPLESRVIAASRTSTSPRNRRTRSNAFGPLSATQPPPQRTGSRYQVSPPRCSSMRSR